MRQIKALTSFLLGLNLVAAENIGSLVENPKVEPTAKSMGDGGMILFRQTYDAVIDIERYPHQRHPVELLFGQVSAWLLTYDVDRFDRKEASIQTDVEVLDAETANIMLVIDFIEEVGAVPDPSGPIEYNGQRWRLDVPVINYALEGDLHEPVEVIT